MQLKQFLPATIFLLFFALFLFDPFLAQAQCPGEGSTGGFLVYRGPLVPCGMHNSCLGSDGNQPCTLCHLLVLINRLYNLLLSLLIIASLLFLTVGGAMYIISAGNPGLRSLAKSIIIKTLTGFGIFLLSWLIVFTVLVFISVNFSSLGLGNESSWHQFNCSTN